MTTGDPGTDAQVTNSGTDENAILDFVIPRGETGGGGTLDVLATVDPTVQSPGAGTALVFNDNPLVSGTSITHTAGSSTIDITQPGVYLAEFHSTVGVDAGTTIPASVRVQLQAGGAVVPGAVATHTFAASSEVATISFSVPFQVTAAPETVSVVVNEPGFNFTESALTIIRLSM